MLSVHSPFVAPTTISNDCFYCVESNIYCEYCRKSHAYDYKQDYYISYYTGYYTQYYSHAYSTGLSDGAAEEYFSKTGQQPRI